MEVDLRRLQRQAAEGPDRHRQLTRKIAVIGNTGSGKTTFARALAERLDVRHVELDALHWRSGWVTTPPEELWGQVEQLVDDAGWVVDGNWGGTLGTWVLDRADQIVWIDLPFPVTFWRLLRRTVRRAWTREALWGTTNHDSFRNALFSRDSILWYLLRTYRHRRRRCGELVASRPHVVLRSRSELDRYLGAAR